MEQGAGNAAMLTARCRNRRRVRFIGNPSSESLARAAWKSQRMRANWPTCDTTPSRVPIGLFASRDAALLAVHFHDQPSHARRVRDGETIQALAQPILADGSDLIDLDLGLPPRADDLHPAAPTRME